MSTQPAPRPVYLETPAGPLFGMFHDGADSPTSRAASAVLIVPPWGWDEVTSYRARRRWAEVLAGSGHPTLRIDFPGTGDSAGDAADDRQVQAWLDSIRLATNWLAWRDVARRVTVIGLGLGGLLACRAIALGATIDEIVLWAVPARGQAFLREARAFASLQDARTDPVAPVESREGVPALTEVGGFLLSSEMMADIAELDVVTMELTGPDRALVLDRDGIASDPAIAASFDRAHVPVRTGPGQGWGSMCFHPERYAPPTRVFDEVLAWLAEAGQPEPGRARPARQAEIEDDRILPRMTDSARIEIDGVAIDERPIELEQAFGRSFGLIAQGPAERQTDVCAVFLNAGAVRRIGPNRMWVTAARRWAARGIPTVRIDAAGIGDSDGDAGMYVDVGRFYTVDRGEHIAALLESLVGLGYGPRFALVGLCAGGYWAFLQATLDPRIVKAVVLNPRALIWDTDLDARREARQVGRLAQSDSWRRIVRGDIDPARAVAIGKAVAGQVARSIGRHVRPSPAGAPLDSVGALESALDRSTELDHRIVLAFSGDEVVETELERDGIPPRLGRWPNVSIEPLPGRDHTVRPMVAQRAVFDLIDREFSALVRDGPAAGPQEPG